AVVDRARRRRQVAHEEREVGDVVLHVSHAARAVVVLLGLVVVDAGHHVVRAAVDDGVGAGAVGAVLGGEVGDDAAMVAAGGGDAHLVHVGVGREVGHAGVHGLPAE